MNNALDLLMLASLFLPLALAGPAILATARPLTLAFPEPRPGRALALPTRPEPQPGELAPAEEVQMDAFPAFAKAA